MRSVAVKDEKKKGFSCGRKHIVRKNLRLKPLLCKETEGQLDLMRGKFNKDRSGYGHSVNREVYI